MFVIKYLSESARLTDNWKHIIPQCSNAFNITLYVDDALESTYHLQKRLLKAKHQGNVSDWPLMIENGNQIFFFPLIEKERGAHIHLLLIEDNQSRFSMVKAQLLPGGVNFPSTHNWDEKQCC